MHRFLVILGLALTLLVASTSAAQAQYVQVYRPVYVSPVPVVTHSSPVVSYYQPPVVTYASPATYIAPAVSYYQPTVAYYQQPTISYYQPLATTVYSSPLVPAPVVTTPGYVSARSYYGYGVFRPRGVYTSYYYNPGYVVWP